MTNVIINESPDLARTLVREQFELAANTDPTNLEANYKAGMYYIITENRQRAVPYLEQVYSLDPNYKFNILFSLGRAYQYAGQFEKAIDYYNQYLEKYRNANTGSVPSSEITLPKSVQQQITECENGIELKNNPIDYSIISLGPSVNSPYPDYAPVFDADESVMVFTTRRQDGNINQDVDQDNFPFEDIFISKRAGENWDYPENIQPPINNKFHNSNLAISADGNTLYLYSDENSGDIYYSEKQGDGTWSIPLEVPGINSSYKENSVSISPDNQLLFFSSNRPGHQGNESNLDIYVAKRMSSGSWGRPVNLGTNINTENDEEGPFIDYDGKTLYFSSNGWNTMGEHDIFKSTYDSIENDWTVPVNMGYPLNTPDDDIYFVATTDGKRGYYASSRDDGQGYLDIYEVRVPETIGELSEVGPIGSNPIRVAQDDRPPVVNGNINPVDTGTPPDTTSNTEVVQREEPPAELSPTLLRFQVLNSNTGSPLEVEITLRGFEDRVLVPVRSEGNGIYQFAVTPAEAKEYVLTVEKPGFVFKNYRMSVPAATPDQQVVNHRVDMEPVSVGPNYVLRNIYFDFNKATFTKESFLELNALEQFLYENGGLTIEISGHTDNIGNPKYNKQLSQLRAEAVRNWLVEKGIDPSRLRSAGYGEEKPLASNDDEKDGRELNRRVEFTILSNRNQ